jgi:hypothetical protein
MAQKMRDRISGSRSSHEKSGTTGENRRVIGGWSASGIRPLIFGGTTQVSNGRPRYVVTASNMLIPSMATQAWACRCQADGHGQPRQDSLREILVGPHHAGQIFGSDPR